MYNLSIVLFLTLTVGCLSSYTVLKNGKKIDWGKSSKLISKVESTLRCKDGQFVGLTDLFSVFAPIIEECSRGLDMSDTSVYPKIALCYMATIGLVDTDGEPNLGRIDAFIQTIYSYEILKGVPELAREAHRCAKEYLYDFNNPMVNATETEGDETFSIFLNCFDIVSQKYADAIRYVCKSSGEV